MNPADQAVRQTVRQRLGEFMRAWRDRDSLAPATAAARAGGRPMVLSERVERRPHAGRKSRRTHARVWEPAE
jgi:hypothetical protein